MARFDGLRKLFRLDRAADVGRDGDEELRFHFEMTVRDLTAAGSSEADARREAERRFGDVQGTRAHLEAIDRDRLGQRRRIEWWSGLGQDLRYASRGLRLKPGFTFGVILTLGLGIGANATMFGIVDRLLFRPPAYLAHADQVHRLYFARTDNGVERIGGTTSYPRYRDIATRTTSFALVVPFRDNVQAVGEGDDSRELQIGEVGAGFWQLFDARPVLGRFFTAEEDRGPAGTAVVVLGFDFWQTFFGGRADVIGSSLRVGSTVYSIIGVAPRGFTGTAPAAAAVFIPLTSGAMQMGSDGVYFNAYNWSFLDILARRRPGVDLATAEADLNQAYLASYAAQRETRPAMPPVETARPRAIAGSVLIERGPRQGDATRVAKWLVGVAVIVLLVACANVGNLLLARAFQRRREIAVRLALGVSRSRLLRLLLTESLLLAGLGGVAGLVLAQWGGALLRRALLPDVAATVLLDRRVLVFAALTALFVSLVTGLAPALHAARSDVAAMLRAGLREGGGRTGRARATLLVVQAALAVVLLVGAGLFVRSFQKVRALPLGYDADHVLMVWPRQRGADPDSAQHALLKQRLVDEAVAMPGVAAAARTISVPFWVSLGDNLYIDGIDSVERLGDFNLQAVSPSYFTTMGTRLLRGRGISPEDRAGAPLVMVVSQAMAGRLWPGQDPMGKCVRRSRLTNPCATVIGIAEDIRARRLTGDADFTYYLSLAQVGDNEGSILVRTSGPAAAAASEVRTRLQRLMPNASYVNVTPLRENLEPHIRSWELGATMFTVFGALAMLVAAVGLYSVVAYGVVHRTHELGIRVALGARGADLALMVLGQSVRYASLGTGLGIVAALAAGRWIQPLLFNQSPYDVGVFATVAAALLLVSAIATLAPARRATRIDPVAALRAD